MDLRSYLAYRTYHLLKMEHDSRYLNELFSKEVENYELKEFLRSEARSLEGQLRKLEQALGQLGAGLELIGRPGVTRALEVAPEVLPLMAERGGHPVTQGILQDHLMFMRMDPPQPLVDLHDLLESHRLQQLEVLAYDALVALAEELHHADVATLLRQNRREQVAARHELQARVRELLRGYEQGPETGEEPREAA